MDELLAHLTSSTGVTPEQARGGSAVLLDLLKKKLDGGAWGDLAKALPGADGLAAEAPKPAGGGLGGLLGGLGGLGGGLGQLAQIASLLDKLGISRAQAVSMAKSALDFLGPRVAPGTRDAIQRVLAGIAG